MKVENLIVKKESFKGNEFYSLFVIIDGKEYRIGTLKEKENYNFINCVHRDFK